MNDIQLIRYSLAFLASILLAGIILFASLTPINHAQGMAAASYAIGIIEGFKPETPEAPVRYVTVIHSCGPHFEGACVRARSGAATTSPVVAQLRNGVVLRTDGVVHTDAGDWYKIIFDEWIRYSGRLPNTFYVSAEFTEPIHGDYLPEDKTADTATTTKHIIIDRGEQKLYAYDGDTLFLEAPVSTGLDLTPTPRGTFSVYRKTPSRYMQGPLPGISDQYYDLPGVSWNLYFTRGGGAIHGAYWHDSFGKQWSHGCVNLPVETAKKLYDWAPLGTEVLVRD